MTKHIVTLIVILGILTGCAALQTAKDKVLGPAVDRETVTKCANECVKFKEWKDYLECMQKCLSGQPACKPAVGERIDRLPDLTTRLFASYLDRRDLWKWRQLNDAEYQRLKRDQMDYRWYQRQLVPKSMRRPTNGEEN